MNTTIRAAVLLGGIFWAQVSRGETIGGPLLATPLDSLAKFQAGRTAFEEIETPEDGLGPIFNGKSCGECHSAGATGGGSERIETRFGVSGEVFDPLSSHARSSRRTASARTEPVSGPTSVRSCRTSRRWLRAGGRLRSSGSA